MAKREPSVNDRLFNEAYLFDFFQAVRLLEMRAPPGRSVGTDTPPGQEPVRFRGHAALSFPPSSIYSVEKTEAGAPRMTVTFLGLLGVSGALPRHYTELLLRHEKESRGKEAGALRAWFDLFNHRLVSLFYRAWKKYRFWPGFERTTIERQLADRRDGDAEAMDPFTRALASLVGLGEPGLRGRLTARTHPRVYGEAPRELARVDDRAIVYYGGLFSQKVHNATALEGLLEDYFRVPVEVRQFQPQWLYLDDENRSHLGEAGVNNRLGVDSIAGQRVYDVQGRIGVRLGPLDAATFQSFLPDRTMTPLGKAFYRIGYLIRLYVGQEFEVDLQLTLKADDVPDCRLPASTADGPQLGWNTWLVTQTLDRDRDDPVFSDTTWKRRPSR